MSPLVGGALQLLGSFEPMHVCRRLLFVFCALRQNARGEPFLPAMEGGSVVPRCVVLFTFALCALQHW